MPGVRAATVHDVTSAHLAREHNDANVVCIGERLTGPAVAVEIVDAFVKAGFEGGRHAARVAKIDALLPPRSPRSPVLGTSTVTRDGGCTENSRAAARSLDAMPWPTERDDEVFSLIDREVERQNTTLQLIASENFTSPAVMAATGSVLTNKYSEGYPGKRYYGGNQVIDEVEEIARRRACDAVRRRARERAAPLRAPTRTSPSTSRCSSRATRCSA